MPTCTVTSCTWRALASSLLILSAFGTLDCQAQEEEALPPTAAEKTRSMCPPKDRPLTALTVDISLPIAEAQAADDMPQGCQQENAGDAVPFMIGYGTECWNCRDLLQLARFCHPRLYFEDVRVERYGFCPMLPCLHTTSEFTCDLFFLPGRLLLNHDHPCVRTPTPHCWSGCSVCGF